MFAALRDALIVIACVGTAHATPTAAQCSQLIPQTCSQVSPDQRVTLEACVRLYHDAGHPAADYFCGRIRHDLGHYKAAVECYERFIDARKDDPRLARKRAQASKWAPLAKAGVGRCAPPPPPMHAVSIRCTPAGARLRIAERELTCGQPLKLPAGAYRAKVSAPGHMTSSQPVTVPSPTPIAITLARVVVATRPPPSVEPRSSVAPWIVGGTGVALLGLGGLLHAENATLYDRLDARGVKDPDLEGEVDAYFYGSVASYGIGTALLTWAAVMLWSDDEGAGE